MKCVCANLNANANVSLKENKMNKKRLENLRKELKAFYSWKKASYPRQTNEAILDALSMVVYEQTGEWPKVL